MMPWRVKRTGDTGLRLALLSTPRTGNTWLRHLLGSLFALDQIAIHRPGQLDWDALPSRCVLQLHWHRSEELTTLLKRHRFRVVVLSRHPLDTLISLLHWVTTCPLPPSVWEDNPCLDGDRGTEAAIRGVGPRDPAFLSYACSPRAEVLLSVSRQWWQSRGAVRVGYEDLVANPVRSLLRITLELVEPPRRTVAEAIAAHSLEHLRDLHPEAPQHFWQGRPGLWRSLLPPPEAHRIAEAQRPAFVEFGYLCEPDEALDGPQADRNWLELRRGEAGPADTPGPAS
jgi:hypothetical protein